MQHPAHLLPLRGAKPTGSCSVCHAISSLHEHDRDPEPLTGQLTTIATDKCNVGGLHDIVPGWCAVFCAGRCLRVTRLLRRGHSSQKSHLSLYHPSKQNSPLAEQTQTSPNIQKSIHPTKPFTMEPHCSTCNHGSGDCKGCKCCSV